MSLPDQTPKLPKLPFLVGDVILIGTACYIAYREAGPLSVPAMAAITACVIVAAILAAVPFLTDYARKQDEALDERQRGLDALSRTINTAAEQISIAANGLNELTDLTHKNLKQAEQLPHKLQDKIAEFNAQLDNARENDREELEKEVSELRASETDRLQAVTDKVHKAVAELSRAESALQQQFGLRIEQFQAAQTAFTHAQAEAVKSAQSSYSALTRELGLAHAKALSEIDRALADRTAAAIRAIESAPPKNASFSPPAVPVVPTNGESHEESALSAPTSPELASDVAAPPKRPRKARREDSSDAHASSPSHPAESPPSTHDAAAESLPTANPPPEPAPIPVETIAHIEPVAPSSQEPFVVEGGATQPSHQASTDGKIFDEAPAPSTTSASSTSTATDLVDRSPKKRVSRKPAPEVDADIPFQLASDESPPSDDSSVTSAEMVERVISSDGATRLIATSYIGIGNRLFIRGEGPGLSWEKGVPLQFVSIGKWRWETADASTPIQFKLFKNDDVECPGLGTLQLEPGHQQEVVAKF